MSDGRWVQIEQAWYDTDTVQCMVCGKLIPRRAWLFESETGEIRSCGPDCQSLFETYWQPRYGALVSGGSR